MIDVSVVCSCAPSYRGICKTKPAAAIARRCQTKRTHYRRLVLEQRCSFSPVVFDALGVPSRQAVDLVTFLASPAVTAGISFLLLPKPPSSRPRSPSSFLPFLTVTSTCARIARAIRSRKPPHPLLLQTVVHLRTALCRLFRRQLMFWTLLCLLASFRVVRVVLESQYNKQTNIYTHTHSRDVEKEENE